MHKLTQTHTHLCTHTQTQTHRHTHTYVQTHANNHTLILTHTHTNTQTYQSDSRLFLLYLEGVLVITSPHKMNTKVALNWQVYNSLLKSSGHMHQISISNYEMGYTSIHTYLIQLVYCIYICFSSIFLNELLPFMMMYRFYLYYSPFQKTLPKFGL